MSKTILLADDSVTIQKVVELTFMDGDYSVVAVSDGLSAVEKLQEARPDLVIADIHMPGTNGYDVCRQSKAAMPEVPVLLLVGTFEPFDEEQAISAGADGHLKKPFDSQVLLARVEELIQRSASGTLPSVAAFEPSETMEPPSLEPPPLAAAPALQEEPAGLPPLATPVPPAPAEDLHATTRMSQEAPGTASPFSSTTEPASAPAEVQPPVDLSAGFSGPQPTSFADSGVADSVTPEPTAFETVEGPVSQGMPEPEAPAFPEVPFSAEPTNEVPQPVADEPEPVAVEPMSMVEEPAPVMATEPSAIEPPAIEPAAIETPAVEPAAIEVPASEPEPVAAAEEPEPVAAAEEAEPVAAASSNGSGSLSDQDVDRIAQRVVDLAGEKLLREVAWEVVPDLAEVIIRERIRELESQVE